MSQFPALARHNMIEGQLLPNNVTDSVLLEVMAGLPRERFLPRALQGVAYVDEEVPLGHGRYLSEALITARLIQAAAVQKTDVVLDIGCATGYSTAVLGGVAGTVVALEQEAAFIQEAEKNLRDLGVINVAVVQRENLAEGYAQQGPYHVILINGAVSAVPQKIKEQLADGGRLVTVVCNRGRKGIAVLITREGDSFTQRILFDAATPILCGFDAPETFAF